MNVSVDLQKCEQCGLCVGASPDVFEFDDDGLLVILNSAPPEQQRLGVEQAVEWCPTGAISVASDVG